MRNTLFFLLFSVSAMGGETAQLLLFSSSQARVVAGLERQRVRKLFAQEEYRRFAKLYEYRATSLEEFEMAKTATILADLDFKITELKVSQANLSLELARKLSNLGRPIPLCKRVKQSDEDTVSPLLKKLTHRPAPPSSEPMVSGTKVFIPDPQSPIIPPQPADPPQPPGPVDPPRPPLPDDPPDPPKPDKP